MVKSETGTDEVGSTYSQLRHVRRVHQRETTAAKIVTSLAVCFLAFEMPMTIIQLIYGLHSCQISELYVKFNNTVRLVWLQQKIPEKAFCII